MNEVNVKSETGMKVAFWCAIVVLVPATIFTFGSFFLAIKEAL